MLKDFFGKKEIEIEEKENPGKLNDIFAKKELEDVDVSGIFLITKLAIFRNKFKKTTLDLTKKLKENVFLSIYPKIKILKLYRPFNNEIKKNKKNLPINLSLEKQENENYTIDLNSLKNRISGPYFDMFISKKSKFISNFRNYFRKINYRFSLKNIFSKLTNKSFGYLYIFFVFIFLFSSYLFATKTILETTFYKLNKINLNDISSLETSLKDTKKYLTLSNIFFKPIYFLNFLVGNNTVDNINYVIVGTNEIIDFGMSGLKIYNGVDELIKEKGVDKVMFSQLISNIEPILLKMHKNLNSGIKYYNNIGNFFREDLNEKFNQNKEKLLIFQKHFNTFYLNLDNIKNILGHTNKRKYLIIFQNSDEIRPTGGFMGSVGIVDIFRGQITNFEKKDIYALEWDLKNFSNENGVAFELDAPEGINKISDTFGLRDANYFVSLKESSKQIKSFLDNTEYKIDGIFYINQNLVLDLLKFTGGVYFESLERNITSQNFSTVFSTLVEAKISKTDTLSTPKQILFDFIEIYLSKLKQEKNYLTYINLLKESLEKKDILVYIFDENENDLLKQIGITKTYDYSKFLDFNYPVFTSISGNKSDRYIKRTFEKSYTLLPNCEINTTFDIKQKHNFNLSDEIEIKSIIYEVGLFGKIDLNSLLEIEGKGKNKQYIRVLIPKNAEIKENDDYKITDYEDYKEVSFYMDTNTLFSNNFSFSYILKNPSCEKYTYTLIKQPGIKDYDINIINNGNLLQSIYTQKDFIFDN